MAMTVQIDIATGATPTWSPASGSTAVWNREDSLAGDALRVPAPTNAGTSFSFVKTFMLNITATGGLSMTDVKVGKTSTESTGKKLWHVTSHAEASYLPATVAPASTGDNNVTAPTINGTTATALPDIGAATVYAAGPFNTTGRKGNLVEVCLGVDALNPDAGTAVATPTLRWQWTEG